MTSAYHIGYDEYEKRRRAAWPDRPEETILLKLQLPERQETFPFAQSSFEPTSQFSDPVILPSQAPAEAPPAGPEKEPAKSLLPDPVILPAEAPADAPPPTPEKALDTSRLFDGFDHHWKEQKYAQQPKRPDDHTDSDQ
jgi:hypothetical protein